MIRGCSMSFKDRRVLGFLCEGIILDKWIVGFLDWRVKKAAWWHRHLRTRAPSCASGSLKTYQPTDSGGPRSSEYHFSVPLQHPGQVRLNPLSLRRNFPENVIHPFIKANPTRRPAPQLMAGYGLSRHRANSYIKQLEMSTSCAISAGLKFAPMVEAMPQIRIRTIARIHSQRRDFFMPDQGWSHSRTRARPQANSLCPCRALS